MTVRSNGDEGGRGGERGAPRVPPDRHAWLRARSLEILLGGQAPSGAFLAGPTFSQYAYAWLRDGAFMAEALDLVGEHGAAGRFHDWVAGVVLASEPGIERAIADGRRGRIPDRGDYLHCRYTMDGSPVDDDWPAFQLDGPGIWLWSLAEHRRRGAQLGPRHAAAADLVARYLAATWRLPCADCWEEFPDHVHTSTLAAILAGLGSLARVAPPPSSSSPLVLDAVAAIATRFTTGEGAFTKWDGSDAVDASLLWIAAPYGLLAADDPRFARTLARIEAELVSADSGVHRYRGDTYYGGGEWVLLTAALGRVLLRRGGPGDRERAEAALDWIAAQAADDGSLPEQVATRALHPDRVDPWRRRWGESARPLLWSHASYLALATELSGGTGGP
jgi:GH15 family glucan-1,4-alpha-glucosidase